MSPRAHARATTIAAVLAFGGFVAALANRDRWPAMVLGVLAIYLVVAADRARSS